MAQAPIVLSAMPGTGATERWRNVTRGKLAILRFGEFGRRISDLISPGAQFSVTADERRLNQQSVRHEKHDIFTNGQTELIEGLNPEDPDYEKLIVNPNLVQTEDIGRIFRLKGERFRERVATITSTHALRRLMEMCEDPKANVEYLQWRMLQDRLAALDVQIEHISPVVQQRIERGEAPNVDDNALDKGRPLS